MKTFSFARCGGRRRDNDAAAQKSDMTGEWVFEVQTDAGSGSPTFVLKQAGDKVTGNTRASSAKPMSPAPFPGKTFKLTFSGDAQGTAVTVTYDGEFESATSVKGKIDLAGLATGTFTGKKMK